MENYFWLGLVGAFIALLFAWTQTRRVKRYSEGTPLMEMVCPRGSPWKAYFSRNEPTTHTF